MLLSTKVHELRDLLFDVAVLIGIRRSHELGWGGVFGSIAQRGGTATAMSIVRLARARQGIESAVAITAFKL